jgi:hypothetical protein
MTKQPKVGDKVRALVDWQSIKKGDICEVCEVWKSFTDDCVYVWNPDSTDWAVLTPDEYELIEGDEMTYTIDNKQAATTEPEPKEWTGKIEDFEPGTYSNGGDHLIVAPIKHAVLIWEGGNFYAYRPSDRTSFIWTKVSDNRRIESVTVAERIER